VVVAVAVVVVVLAVVVAVAVAAAATLAVANDLLMSKLLRWTEMEYYEDSSFYEMFNVM
jgi:hypothetical protein